MKAPALAVVLGGKGKSKPYPAKGDDDADDMDVSDDEVSTSKQDAADEAFDAVKAGDKAKFGAALSTYVNLCMKG